MPVSFLTSAIFIISIITNVTVEGIKKLLNGTKIKCSSNILAAIVSVVIAFAVCIIYLIMNDIAFNLKISMEIAIMMYSGFLVSTVGYDKIAQTLNQIQNGKEK